MTTDLRKGMKVAALPILLLAGLLCAGAEEPPAEKLTPQQLTLGLCAVLLQNGP